MLGWREKAAKEASAISTGVSWPDIFQGIILHAELQRNCSESLGLWDSEQSGLCILVVIYEIEVLHAQQKLDSLLLQTFLNPCSSLSTGSIAELWLRLCYTVGEKTFHSTPSIQCTSVVFSWFARINLPVKIVLEYLCFSKCFSSSFLCISCGCTSATGKAGFAVLFSRLLRHSVQKNSMDALLFTQVINVTGMCVNSRLWLCLIDCPS